jgi:2-dehydro-3-deoxyglucarate aldolase/4-hydroxy-2-oxoheptanedioate aldolase
MSSLNNVEKFLSNVASGRAAIGAGVSLSDPIVSELFGEAGYDFIWIDLEHSSMNVRTALGHVIAARGVGMAPFIRVPWNDPVLIKPILELAPAAVIVPMIRTPEEAARAVSACKYPPAGVRGFGPNRGIRFGGVSTADYLANADRQTLVMVQVEHIDAIKHLEEIVATPGIDGICVGPNDLSGSMGKLGQTSDPQVRAEIVRIIRATRKGGKLAGIATGFDSESFRFWLDSGIQWINLGADWIHLFAQGRDIVQRARAVEAESTPSD